MNMKIYQALFASALTALAFLLFAEGFFILLNIQKNYDWGFITGGIAIWVYFTMGIYLFSKWELIKYIDKKKIEGEKNG